MNDDDGIEDEKVLISPPPSSSRTPSPLLPFYPEFLQSLKFPKYDIKIYMLTSAFPLVFCIYIHKIIRKRKRLFFLLRWYGLVISFFDFSFGNIFFVFVFLFFSSFSVFFEGGFLFGCGDFGEFAGIDAGELN